MTRVVIADDQELVRTGFKLILDIGGIEVVGEAADGREAIDVALKTLPDVVLMDVRMPGMDGLEATRRLTALAEPPRVLILTTFDVDDYVYEAIRSGASGFLLKSVPRDQLISGVRLVAGGESLLAPVITRRLIERFAAQPAPGSGRSLALLSGLSEREQEVMRLMARGRTNLEIAADLVVATSTVKTHVASILRKLDLRDRVHVVIAAYEAGLVQPGHAPPSG